MCNLMIHRAMDMLHAGDVLVVDGGGALDNALIGELIMMMAIEKGATGFIIKYVAHTRVAANGRNLHHLFTGYIVAEGGKIKLLRETFNMLALA